MASLVESYTVYHAPSHPFPLVSVRLIAMQEDAGERQPDRQRQRDNGGGRPNGEVMRDESDEEKRRADTAGRVVLGIIAPPPCVYSSSGVSGLREQGGGAQERGKKGGEANTSHLYRLRT